MDNAPQLAVQPCSCHGLIAVVVPQSVPYHDFAAGLTHRTVNRFSITERVGNRFFQQDCQTATQRIDGWILVMWVGARDDHRLDVLLFKHFAMPGIPPHIQSVPYRRRPVVVGIDHSHEFRTGEVSGDLRVALPHHPNTDDSYPDSFILRLHVHALLFNLLATQGPSRRAVHPPVKPASNTVMAMAIPAKVATHQALCRYTRPSPIMPPHDGIGG